MRAHVRLPVLHVEHCTTCPFARPRIGAEPDRVCISVAPPRDITLGRRQLHPLWCPLRLGPTVVGLPR